MQIAAATQQDRLPAIFARRTLTRWLPEFGGVIWLALLAATIGIHTHASVQPPIFDAFTYYEKAWQFWSAVHRWHLFNPMNLEPTLRPPGTVLMSYPIGFNPDPRAFYFRSIYFPAVLLFTSVLVALYDFRSDENARARTILTAAFFCGPTLLYQFELGPGMYSFWGLVDGFLAGLAALGAAAAWRSTRASRALSTWIFIAVTALASTLSMLVKPSGVMVAAIIGIGWLIFALSRIASEWSSAGGRGLMMRLLAGGLLIGSVDGLVLLAAVSSRYLSHENIQTGLADIAFMKSELRLPVEQLWPIINSGFGGQYVIWFVLSAVLIPFGWWRSRRSAPAESPAAVWVAAIVGWFVFLFGIWFWIVGSGGITQIRYGVPFFMTALIWMLPGSVRSWPFASWIRATMSVLAIAATLNLTLLLLMPIPAAAWQKFSGVGLTSSFPSPVIGALEKFVSSPRIKPAVIYAFSMDANDAVLDALAHRSQLFHPELPPISVIRPLDWIRPTTFRIGEISAADYLLISPEQGDRARTSGPIPNIDAERAAFTRWADRLNERDGVTTLFDERSAKLIRVENREEFRSSLDQMVCLHSWNSAFVIANSQMGRLSCQDAR